MTATRSLGLPDDAFAQKRPLRGLITKAEVRAVSLYHMGLRQDSIVWDVGAGTGSVALEAAVVAHEGKTYAIERDAESLEMLRDNVQHLGPQNVEIIEGSAPQALKGLPTPDSVFIGGSGGKLTEILDCCITRLNSGGRIVVNLAAMERANEAYSFLNSRELDSGITMVSASRGKKLPDDSTRFEALNPVFVVTAQKREDRG